MERWSGLSGPQMQSTLSSPYLLIWSRRELLLRVVETTLRQRYAGSLLGTGWLLVGPLLLMATYSFMFVVVLGVKPPSLSGTAYIAHLAAGLVVYLTIAQCLMGATGALTNDPSLLFNRVFPAELFPVREVVVGLPLLGGACLFALGWGAISGVLGWAWIWLPVVVGLLILTLIGCAWVVSLANLVTRDAGQILGYLLIILMLTSPIAYEPSMLPERARFLVDANPVAYFTMGVQQIVVHGQAPQAGWLLGMSLTAFASFHLGYALFIKGKSIISESI